MDSQRLLIGLLWLSLCRPLVAGPSHVLEMRLAPHHDPPAGTALAVQLGSGPLQRLCSAWKEVAEIDPMTGPDTVQYVFIIDQWSALHASDRLLHVEYRLRRQASLPP